MGIVLIGASFVDIKGIPTSPFIPAGRNVGRVEIVHGGVCRNVAQDIANMQLHPSFLSVFDADGTGHDVAEHLNRCGCSTEHCSYRQGGLGTWLAVFDNTGDVVASISRRPDLSPVRETLAVRGDEIISAADSIVIEIDADEDIVRQVVELAEKWGKTVYAVVSNMSIAMERRALTRRTGCLVCNQQEAGIFFSETLSHLSPAELDLLLPGLVQAAGLPRMVVTMGGAGSVWAQADGQHGICPAIRVDVKDTTGAGDAFFAGVAAGLTYGKSLGEACHIGTRLAASVIVTTESVCPPFTKEEFGF